MTDKTDSKEREVLREAERLLRRDAESLRESHTSHANREDWTGEEEAKAGYDEYIRAADALAALDGRDSFAIGFPEGVSRDDTVHGRTYYTAENMAWASAKGFREGVASLAASAGSEPVAWRAQFDAWWARNRVSTHQVKNIGGFAAKVWHAAIQTVVGATDSTAGFYPADEGSTPSRQATHPSPPEGAGAERALRKVLSVVQRYLPPDGPSAHDAMSEITAIVDPWPLGPLEKP